jgi:dienelactone hydrolase
MNIVSIVFSLCLCASVVQVLPAAETGTVRFTPIGDQSEIPERYRLSERTFDWKMSQTRTLLDGAVDVYAVTFPSPVETPTPENNTVHAEYYRPKGDGPFPAVIVLDITGGDQKLSRIIATALAQNKIAALFVQMAYYGPRRPPGSKLRLLSTNIPQTMGAVTQTVLDCRFAAAWLAARPEVDASRIGILGTSLGSFISCLTGEMDQRISRVAILLGGGGLVDAFYTHPMAQPYVKVYEALGGTKEKVKELIAPVDPITKACNLKDRKVLIIAAKRDEIVPPACTTALWEAIGKPKIIWYDTTHYGAAIIIPFALKHVVEHFEAK